MSTSLPPAPTATSPPTMTFSSSASPSATGGGGGGGTQNSPLLFFVALGFGVVFTNLWIIVGVKYCFRYNARNRARANGVDEVDLQAIGTRPHRRRREKKLMTVDEVNERFPVTKYKAWRANREVMGLPAAGGIAPTDGTTPAATQAQTEVDPPASPLPKLPEPVADPSKPATTPERESQELPTIPAQTQPQTQTQPAVARSSTEIRRVQSERDGDNDHDNDEDEPVPSLPADMANSCGDTCAICIDNLEDTDDVRGLTCGHAFHTACIDPWLTSRRACCPLCKADYYVPKPRTEAEIEAEEAARERRRQQAAEVHRHPISAWWYRAESYIAPPASGPNSRSRRRADNGRRPQTSRLNPFSRNAASNPPASSGSPEIQQTSSTNFFSRFTRHSRSNSRANPNPTPSNLEAGLADSNTTPAPATR